MKIAMPYQGGYVSEHLGRSNQFIVFEAENGEITGRKILTCEDHGNLANLFKAEGVDVVIGNLISRPLLDMIYFSGMEVITRAYGEAEKVAADYIRGELETGSACRGGDKPRMY
jgi:predicted Fe-Mo cluster-binding NifX family protein